MIYSEIKVTGIKEVQKRLGSFKNKTPLVLSRAINRAINNANKNVKKETTARYFISSTDVKDTIKIKKASKGSLKAAVISRDEGIALSRFKVLPQKTNKSRNKSKPPKIYKAGVKKDGGVKPLDGNPKAFVAKMKTGHVGVFERKSEKRFPIKQLFGPSTPQIIKNEDTISIVKKEASEMLQKRIDAEINNILRKGG